MVVESTYTVQFFKLSEIKSNPNNPRVIKDDKFKKLVQSLKDLPEMAEVRPIVVNTDMIVLGGNMRLKAMQEAGWKQAPVQIVDWPEEKQRQFIIKDNVGFGEWDWDMLGNDFEMQELNDWGLDVPDFKVEPEAEEDDYEIPAEISTDIVLGDLFEIGQHRLLCGDSTNADDVARLMDGKTAEIIFTSPPYNLGKNVKLSTRSRKDNAYETYDDNKTGDEYFDLLKGFTNAYWGQAEYMIVNVQSLAGNKKTVIDYQYEYKDFVADISIWYKSNPQPAAAKKVMNSAFEYLIILSKEENPKRAISTATFHGTFSNVYVGTVNSENIVPDMHSAAFPLTMCAEYLKAFCSESVIDSFMGTGTTMAAAHQLSRKCYGMELDPKYCQVIIDRMLKLDPSLQIKRNGQPYKNCDETVMNG